MWSGPAAFPFLSLLMATLTSSKVGISEETSGSGRGGGVGEKIQRRAGRGFWVIEGSLVVLLPPVQCLLVG